MSTPRPPARPSTRRLTALVLSAALPFGPSAFAQSVPPAAASVAPGAGAAFYEFPRIADTVAYKEGYRRRLDTAAWSPDERDALLDEVRIAYGLNTDVFADLGRTLAAGGFE